MHKLIVHNLSIPYAHQPHDLYRFNHLGIFFACANDVVVLQGEAPDPAFLTYLEKEKIITSPIHFFASTNSPGPFSIFGDQQLTEELKKFFLRKKTEEWQLDTFTTTTQEKALAEKLGIPFKYNPKQCAQIGTKSAFRNTAKRLGIAVPQGSESCVDALSIAFAAGKLFLFGAHAVIVKEDEGVAGLSSCVISKREFMAIMQSFQFEKLFPPEGVVPARRKQCIVEEWHNNVFQSPSVQCYVDGNGALEVLSLHNQLMRSNKMTYRGSQSKHWLSEKTCDALLHGAQTYAKGISRSGFQGHFSLNAVLLDTHELLFVEANIRRVMSSYPSQIMRRLGFSQEDMPPHISMEVQNDAWKDITHAELLARCKPLLYTKERRSGVIPFDVKLLRARGAVFFLAIGKTKKEAEQYIDHVRII